jgi:hypothetical protein
VPDTFIVNVPLFTLDAVVAVEALPFNAPLNVVYVAVVPEIVVIAPEAPRSCVVPVVPNVVPVRVVMLAEVLLRFVTVAEV